MINKKKEQVQTNFCKVMGNSVYTKLIDFFIENDRTHWSMYELTQANVGYSTLKLVLPKLLENGLIIVDEQYGKIKLYRINKENIVVKKIYNLYDEINKQEIMRKTK